MKQNIENIYAGINYIKKDGTSRARDFEKQFIKDHSNAKLYTGDLRKEKQKFKVVYRLLTYNYNNGYSNKWKSTLNVYVEE